MANEKVVVDLFCGKFGWSQGFVQRGWKCIGIDLVAPKGDVPEGCEFIQADVMTVTAAKLIDLGAIFGVASSPCEQFSVFGMPHFHKNPKFPETGLKLFNHTKEIFEQANIPYVMENVRSAQKFVGDAVHHCGPFYLWGTAVPPLMPQGIKKGIDMGSSAVVKGMSRAEITAYRKKFDVMWSGSKSAKRKASTAKVPTIPIELAVCVADYAERILGF